MSLKYPYFRILELILTYSNVNKGLDTNYREGEPQNGSGGGGGDFKVKFYPYEKEAEHVLAMLKGGGGGTTGFEVVLTWKLESLAILMGGGGAKMSTF